MRRIERESRGIMRPGQDLVVGGYAGLEGSRRIALAREEELSRWFSRRFIEDTQQGYGLKIDSSSHDWKSLGASEWEETGEGGIYTALWNISGAYMLGFTVDLLRIPIKQGTIEICERYELNPYRLLSGNCMVFAADHGERLTEALTERKIPARIVGRVNSGIGREIIYGQVHGFMERPREDELYRLAEFRKE